MLAASNEAIVPSPTGFDHPATEVRKHDRLRVREAAIIYYRKTFQSVVIVDVSKGGVALEGAGGLFTGDRVNITTLSGNSVPGVVRWWLAGRCGIQFDEELDERAPFWRDVTSRCDRDHARMHAYAKPLWSCGP